MATSLLLHFDGTDGVEFDATFQDETGKTITSNEATWGKPEYSSSAAKFGDTGAFFNYSSYFTTPLDDDFDFGSGDFTIEFWLKRTTETTSGAQIGYGTVSANMGGTTGTAWALGFANSYKNLYFTARSDATTRFIDGELVSGFPTLFDNWPTDRMVHFALTRSGNTWRSFLDGVKFWEKTSSETIHTPTSGSLFFGQQDSNGGNFYDELRIVKGEAIYTADFTPPTAPFTSGYADTEASVVGSTSTDFISTVVETEAAISGTSTASFINPNSDMRAVIPCASSASFYGATITEGAAECEGTGAAVFVSPIIETESAICGTSTAAFVNPVVDVEASIAGTTTLSFEGQRLIEGLGVDLAGSAAVSFIALDAQRDTEAHIYGTSIARFTDASTLVGDATLSGTSAVRFRSQKVYECEGACAGSSTFVSYSAADQYAAASLSGSGALTAYGAVSTDRNPALAGTSAASFVGEAATAPTRSTKVPIWIPPRSNDIYTTRRPVA